MPALLSELQLKSIREIHLTRNGYHITLIHTYISLEFKLNLKFKVVDFKTVKKSSETMSPQFMVCTPVQFYTIYDTHTYTHIKLRFQAQSEQFDKNERESNFGWYHAIERQK